MFIKCCYITGYSQNSLKIITSIFFFSPLLWTKSLGRTLLGHCDHHCGPGPLMSNNLSIKTAVAWSFPRTGESASRQLSHRLSIWVRAVFKVSLFPSTWLSIEWLECCQGLASPKENYTRHHQVGNRSSFHGLFKSTLQSHLYHILCHMVLLWLTAAGGSTRCDYQAARMAVDQSWVPLSKRKKSVC